MEQNGLEKNTYAPFDLHMHSRCSDGADVIAQAARRGITMAALTDHDCVTGVAEALEAGRRLGVRVLPALEMDCEWRHELHILGLDVDPHEARLEAALETARRRRMERNAEIVRRLCSAGMDIRPHLTREPDVATRLHIALALVRGGFAENAHDAFVRYLRRGGAGYYAVARFSPEEVITLILGAGGAPVWAHPTHGGADVHKLSLQLKSYGLMGLEAYHPSMSEGESAVLVSIAAQNGLLVTCGSDYHGANRPEVTPGQTWRDTPQLRESRRFFESRSAGRAQSLYADTGI
jgi:predicted metal-dependent phosphoesterase TrpH